MYVRLSGSFDPNPFSTPFGPNFTICKSEGGSATCPSKYVKEFSGYQRRPGYLGDLSDTWFGK